MSSHDWMRDGDLVAAVRTHLAEEEATMRVPTGDVRDVVERGRRRQRTTMIGAGAAVVAVVAGVVVALTGTGQPPATTPDVAVDTGLAIPPLAGSGPELVITTPDGVVRWRDGATVEVPGLGAAVEAAFPDGEGGIVFSRDDRVARMTANGEIDVLTEPEDVAWQPPLVPDGLVDVRLEDVDPMSGRIAILTLHMPDERAAGTSVVSQIRRLNRDGGIRQTHDAYDWSREGFVGEEVSIAEESLVVMWDRGGGAGQLHSPALVSWGPSSPPRLVGVEVDHDSSSVVSLAVAPDGAVSLVRRAVPDYKNWGVDVSKGVIEETPLGPLLDPLGVVPVDVTSLSGSLVVLTVEHDDGRRTPALLDVDTGEVTLVDVEGTARLAPLDTP